MAETLDEYKYDDSIVRSFLFATIFWGLVGMGVGILIALQLVLPELNLGIPYTAFGRLRPLHTNAVIFAFCGNAIFAAIYYTSQRLLKTRMAFDGLSRFHFWGWQAIIAAAAITLPLGLSGSKEYAELEWPIDLAIAVVWLAFAVNYFCTLARRREPVLYVSIWFYIATIVTVTMLHVVNSLALPVGAFKSYSVFPGVNDALVQWWYGHNAVAFFLTTPFLGLAYYFIPKAVGKPIYSYRLSIIHFWSLIFIYIWAGPHHLQYTSLPEWLQSLGMVFSVMLLAPSWGGAINFVLTMRNGWNQVKSDPVVKFFAAGTTFYMMATFEGPLLSIKSVSKVAHYTDWIVGHVHSGALGWNGLLIFGMCYWLVPRLYATTLHSVRLANLHFWMATAGIAIYIVAMWISGVTQGVMAIQTGADGSLSHPSFLEIMLAVKPLHAARAFGGMLYFAGSVLLAYNLYKTISGRAVPADTPARAPAFDRAAAARRDYGGVQANAEHWPSVLTVLAAIAVAAGGILEIVPMLAAEPRIIVNVHPYTPLELEGRDLYIREGCNNCHSQQVRPILGEAKRYGPPSQAGEFVYDFPHLWGSKRTGPDLHRVGGKYGDSWHWKHMIDPRSVSPDSIMPSYAWLAKTRLDTKLTRRKLKAMRILGVPYTDEDIANADKTLDAQRAELASKLATQGESPDLDSELIALVAYLQRLGRDARSDAKEAKP